MSDGGFIEKKIDGVQPPRTLRMPHAYANDNGTCTLLVPVCVSRYLACPQHTWPAAGTMVAPTTPPLRPRPMDVATPPRIRVQTYVEAGVTFANAISNTIIWQVDERVPIGAAIREISKRTGADISKIKFLHERGPVSFKENIDENVAVLLLTE